MRTAFFSDETFLRHDTGPHHPESFRRLEAVLNRLERTSYFGQMPRLRPRQATMDEAALIHNVEYIHELETMSKRGGGDYGPDTPVSRNTYDAATLASGAGIQAVEQILSGEVDRAFIAARPPGHHALRDSGMGFCLLNHVAIAAAYLAQKGIERIAIVDFDVHHGNGTQDAFYNNANVFFASLHQYPFYPGSGDASEDGSGDAVGTTLNLPMKAGSSDADYRNIFHEALLPGLARFHPQFLMISAGFDAHKDDPLGGMNLTSAAYEWMTQELVKVADTYCERRIISFLEGGYNVQALAESVELHIAAML